MYAAVDCANALFSEIALQLRDAYCRNVLIIISILINNCTHFVN